ncbi:anaerobic glycerol-3-phosphate dehydrogenase subunit B, partial [human gut metagenome]
IGAEIREDRVRQIRTANHGEVALQADNYVLASGSFFSKGLVADMTRIAEPLFDLDVAFDTDRTAWYDPYFFHRQNYITYGVAVDEEFRARKQGRTIENLYVTGSVLGGFDPIREGCGAGVAMLTALHVADKMK